MSTTVANPRAGRHKFSVVTVLTKVPEVGEISLARCLCAALPVVYSGDREAPRGCPGHHPRQYAYRNAKHRANSRVYDTFYTEEDLS